MAASSNGPHPAIKKRILVFCDYYLPSTKGGGGTWTVVNLIERFCGRYDFFVVTRNHQSRTDITPFTTVVSNSWNDIGNAMVFYLSPNHITDRTLERLVSQISPDAVFLNSVFSKPVITFLRLRKRRSIRIPVILSPCGELSEGALSLKRWKKRVFLAYAKAVGIYSGVTWKATTSLESVEIRRIFGTDLTPRIAPDMPPRKILPDFAVSEKTVKVPGSARLIYYSRIDRKKNLLFLLDVLSRTDRNHCIDLTIAGPIDDESYWQKCQEKIDQLRPFISIEVVGAVSQQAGLKLLMENHFFILPTLGENFGYVILEALAAGCPAAISDRTIWEQLPAKNAGWTISLDDTQRWIEAIGRCIDMDQDEFFSCSSNARRIAMDWLRSPEVELATQKVLAEAIGV